MQPFDCELLRAGWPAQPINSASAVAFVLAAAVLWRREKRLAAPLALLAGVGSIWFHAAPSDAASWVHDIGLYGLLAVAAVELWRELAAGRPPLLAASLAGVGLLVWFFSRTGGALCDPESVLQGHALWHVLAAAAVVTLFTGSRQSDVSAPG